MLSSINQATICTTGKPGGIGWDAPHTAAARSDPTRGSCASGGLHHWRCGLAWQRMNELVGSGQLTFLTVHVPFFSLCAPQARRSPTVDDDGLQQAAYYQDSDAGDNFGGMRRQLTGGPRKCP